MATEEGSGVAAGLAKVCPGLRQRLLPQSQAWRSFVKAAPGPLKGTAIDELMDCTLFLDVLSNAPCWINLKKVFSHLILIFF